MTKFGICFGNAIIDTGGNATNPNVFLNHIAHIVNQISMKKLIQLVVITGLVVGAANNVFAQGKFFTKTGVVSIVLPNRVFKHSKVIDSYADKIYKK